MSSLRTLPFSSWDEWLKVYHSFFCHNNNYLLQEEGIKIVESWRIRGNLPHSIDLTALFLEVQLQDPFYYHKRLQEYQNSVENLPENDENNHNLEENNIKNNFFPSNYQLLPENTLKFLYPFLIIRSINGIIDPNQQNFFAKSILTIGKTLNIPGWIVEMRHDSTHKTISSLNNLRKGCDFMLTWYKNYYWNCQYDILMDKMKRILPQKLLVSFHWMKIREEREIERNRLEMEEREAKKIKKEDYNGKSNEEIKYNKENYNIVEVFNNKKEWMEAILNDSKSLSYMSEIFIPTFLAIVITNNGQLNLDENEDEKLDNKRKLENRVDLKEEEELNYDCIPLWESLIRSLFKQHGENLIHLFVSNILSYSIEILENHFNIFHSLNHINEDRERSDAENELQSEGYVNPSSAIASSLYTYNNDSDTSFIEDDDEEAKGEEFREEEEKEEEKVKKENEKEIEEEIRKEKDEEKNNKEEEELKNLIKNNIKTNKKDYLIKLFLLKKINKWLIIIIKDFLSYIKSLPTNSKLLSNFYSSRVEFINIYDIKLKNFSLYYSSLSSSSSSNLSLYLSIKDEINRILEIISLYKSPLENIESSVSSTESYSLINQEKILDQFFQVNPIKSIKFEIFLNEESVNDFFIIEDFPQWPVGLFPGRRD